MPWLDGGSKPSCPAIMESLESIPGNFFSYGSWDEKSSHPNNDDDCFRSDRRESDSSILLIDRYERLRVTSAIEFCKKLRCRTDIKVKVVSIFGNTGDGKSHTLNQTFFDRRNVFSTSNEQSSCTLGVWAAFDPRLNVICLDTEGLLCVTAHENERTRLLLKVLAVSDLVLYRTRSERLHRDLFTFLSAASRAYGHHFQAALQALGKREGVTSPSGALGPGVIVFHETRHTKPLSDGSSESAEEILRTRFAQLQLEIEAFSSIKYVGVQTLDPPTDYEPLRRAVINELDNTTVRSARKPNLVYGTLRILNDKFSGEITRVPGTLFPDQYFTCPIKCLSCDCRCRNSMGHLREGKPHANDTRCKYQHQYENVIYICKKCHGNGNEVVVTSRTQTQNDNSWYGLAKYAWSGYVIECPHCGEIYRSRQYWYGNKSPEDAAVRTEINHVWSAAKETITNQNTAQKVIDGVSYITEAVASASLQPTRALTAWVADQVAPTYWRPNNEIKCCHGCGIKFGPTDYKHHCRSCGEGFCAKCSSKAKSVPARNWFTPVRVCDACFTKDANSNEESMIVNNTEDVSVRKVTEHVVSTLNAVGTVLTYSKSLIKDTVRPTYWIPDSELTDCCVCSKLFTDLLPLHHCRDCGRGVCQMCSQHRKPVLRRGWDKPVRVCDLCIKVD